MIELRSFATVGRSLVATQQFRPGDVVLSDKPALRWSSESPLPDDMEAALSRFTTVHRVLAAAVNAFVTNINEPNVIRCVLDLHAPDLPISKATDELFEFCRCVASTRPHLAEVLAAAPERLAGARNAAGDTTAMLAHVCLAAKVNAHRAANGDWCIFQLASKLAHSCDPNVFFLPPDATGHCQFVALHHIAADELLSFSYLGGRPLLLSTQQRQERLKASHLFICRCRRCEGPDFARQLRCPNRCGSHEVMRGVAHVRLTRPPPCIARLASPLSLTDDDAFPDKVWTCRNCQSTFSDLQLKTTICEEQRVVADVEAVQSQSYKLADIKELTADAAAELGYAHHAYVTMTQHMMNYFRLLVTSGCGDAFAVFMCWAARYIDALALQCIEVAGTERQRSELDFPHMLSVATVLMAANLFERASPEDKRRFKPVVAALAKAVEPMVEATYPDDPRRKDLAACARQADLSLPLPETESMIVPLHTTLARIIIQYWPDEGSLRAAINCPSTGGMQASTRARSGTQSPAPGDSGDDHGLSTLFELWDRIVASQKIRQALA